MKTSIKELAGMTQEDQEHRCLERMIEHAISDNRLETALAYMWRDVTLNQTGGTL